MRYLSKYKKFTESKLITENIDEFEKIQRLIQTGKETEIELAFQLAIGLELEDTIIKHYEKYFQSYEMEPSLDNLKTILLKIYKFLNLWDMLDYTITPEGKININGSIDLSYSNLSSFPVRFGIIQGSFDISHNKFTSLIGGPDEVSEGYYCNSNQLTTIDECPKTTLFSCSYNQLTSLKGISSEVTMVFCNNNKIDTLEDCPSNITGSFLCNNNLLTSLKGLPSKIGQELVCYNNLLTSLEGCPEEIGRDFLCFNNKLTSLKGMPKKIGGNFICKNNQITIINDELVETKVEGKFDITGNPIEKVYNVFNDFLKFKESLDYKYLREPNIIVRFRFEEACQEADIQTPTNIEGYTIE